MAKFRCSFVVLPTQGVPEDLLAVQDDSGQHETSVVHCAGAGAALDGGGGSVSGSGKKSHIPPFLPKLYPSFRNCWVQRSLLLSLRGPGRDGVAAWERFRSGAMAQLFSRPRTKTTHRGVSWRAWALVLGS